MPPDAPAHHDHTGEAEITEWSVEAPDYATAKAEIDATVGEAEVLLYYRPER